MDIADALDLFRHYVRNIVPLPNTLGAFRGFLGDHQVLGKAPRAIAHPHFALVPSNQVHYFQTPFGQPRLYAGADMELVHPEKQMA